jgi:AIPR protein
MPNVFNAGNVVKQLIWTRVTVNDEIRSTIEHRATNEFALFNNGITVLSDGTFLNERIGQKDRAQLTLVNPQIINGGQTAYVLSQLYRDYQGPERDRIFGEKEVLVKIITFDGDEKLPEQKKLDLIDSISRATNSQTVVSKADRRSNESDLKKLQKRCFESFGIWLERKRGEFTDGVREGYLDPSIIVDRNLFIRAIAIARGDLKQAGAKRIFAKSDFGAYVNAPYEEFRRYNLSLRVLRSIHEESGVKRSRIQWNTVSRAYVAMLLLSERTSTGEASDIVISECVSLTNRYWTRFRRFLAEKYPEVRFRHIRKGQGMVFSMNSYFNFIKVGVQADVREFFAAPDKYQAEELESATVDESSDE